MLKPSQVIHLLLTCLLSVVLYACNTASSSEISDDTKQPQKINNPATTVLRLGDLDLQEVQNNIQEIAIPISGRIISGNQSQLFSEVQGKIMSTGKGFKKGTAYAKGETMLWIDSKEYRLNLESQRSNFLNIGTQSFNGHYFCHAL